jgi:hypothetical protein
MTLGARATRNLLHWTERVFKALKMLLQYSDIVSFGFCYLTRQEVILSVCVFFVYIFMWELNYDMQYLSGVQPMYESLKLN